ncbi:unnamed protein product [Heligmosomoides polygyrus]|uniref:Uncharacterized protein n=1 Tax=Heligmosomoides polygyrus TaxID=6339 RepID=A0A3P7UJT2_HELPZ|nr:unnamed protein product [Heligmosomoides polygyrus]
MSSPAEDSWLSLLSRIKGPFYQLGFSPTNLLQATRALYQDNIIAVRNKSTTTGDFFFQESSVSCATGVAGVPIELVGCAPIRFQIVKSYNIILGNDFLSRLPKWNIDIAERKLRIGSSTINIMVMQPRSGRIREPANEDAVVRVA